MTWTNEELNQVANHLETCTGPPECPGRHPNFSACYVAEIAAELLAARQSGEIQILTTQRDEAWARERVLQDRVDLLKGALERIWNRGEGHDCAFVAGAALNALTLIRNQETPR